MADDLRELIERVSRSGVAYYAELRVLLDVARATLTHNERKVAECEAILCGIAHPLRGLEQCPTCPRRQMVAVQHGKDGG